MTIASLPFLGFAALVAVLLAAIRHQRVRQLALLAANLAFLASFVPSVPAIIPLAGFILAGYAGFWLISSTRSGRLHLGVIAAVILLFFWLKQYSFLPAGSFLAFGYTTIGLSYIFFRALHMLLDARDGGGPGRVGPIAYLNYLLNFTSLVSGPIQTFQSYAADQLGERLPAVDWIDFGLAVERIARGLFKVIVLGTVLSGVHRTGLDSLPLADDAMVRMMAALELAAGYTFYLYCNFSGYTDIVLGAARLYGLRMPENFDRPFSAPSFIEFWGRWHMTLSNWLKVYVYNPLVMALMERFPSPRLQEAHGIVAYFVTFFLIGLWHGQTSVFAFYGLLLGAGVSLNRLYQVAMIARFGRRRYNAIAGGGLYRMAARGLTFTYFTLSLFAFWGSWSDMAMVAGRLGAAGGLAFLFSLWIGASVVLEVAERGQEALGRMAWLRSRYTRTVVTTVLASVAVAALLLMATPAPDIVYETF